MTPYMDGRRMRSIEGQALHSRFLDLHHPVTGEAMHFEAPVPEDMLRCLEIAGKDEL